MGWWGQHVGNFTLLVLGFSCMAYEENNNGGVAGAGIQSKIPGSISD